MVVRNWNQTVRGGGEMVIDNLDLSVNISKVLIRFIFLASIKFNAPGM